MPRVAMMVGLMIVGMASVRAEDDPLAPALKAMQERDYAKARELAQAVAKAQPTDFKPSFIIGLASLQLRDNLKAEEAFTTVIKLNPKLADAYDRRGDARLKAGKFKESVADFDQFLEMRPEVAPDHWRRGIALYYAGRFADGVAQFELHKKVNPEDVENAVWHYLCNARAKNPETAQKQLIVVTRDARVPMAQVQALFAGQAKPEDVLAAAEKIKAGTEAGIEARFYAHLYLALYAETRGESAKVKEHLTKAVQDFKIGHYMWDVGAAHLASLNKPTR